MVRPPTHGIWRVGRGPDPLAVSEPQQYSEAQPTVGNRFDSFRGKYSVLYFATKLEGCFAETLSRFRPDPALLAMLADEWAERGFMTIGAVPKDWRTRRVMVRARVDSNLPFLDVEDAETLAYLQEKMGAALSFFNLRELDVATVRGPNRALTRYISEMAWLSREVGGEEDMYAGIRYISRLDSECECWAVFDDVGLIELERRPVLGGGTALTRIASRYGLTIH